MRIRRAFHRAPLIDDEFFLLPLRFVNRGTEISFVQFSTHTQTHFFLFFESGKDREIHTEKNTNLGDSIFSTGYAGM
jgi:hypothetical protein